MRPSDLPEPKAGAPITEAFLGRFVRAIEDMDAGTSGPGAFETSGPGGRSISPVRRQEYWIKLTGGGPDGEYAWTEQVPAPAGGWEDSPLSGTAADDPAIEAGGNAGLATDGTVRVWARRDTLGRLVFQRGSCS